MRKALLIVAATLFVAARASAAELDADEKAWAAQCFGRLSSKSVRVRDGAERAVGALGLDALPELLAFVGDAKTSVDPHELARAIAAMGPGAAQSLEDRRASWPKFTEMMLGGVLEELRALEEKAKKDAAPDTTPPTAPEDVEAKVAEILDKYRGVSSIRSPDPMELALIKLGRPAIGALLKVLCRSSRHDDWAVTSKAKSALAGLVEAQDVPMLAKLVREGHPDLVAVFENLDSKEAVEAIAGFIRGGTFDHGIGAVLSRRLDDPQIVDACCAWLQEPVFDGDMNHGIATMADIVGGSDRPGFVGWSSHAKGALRMPAAAPALKTLLDRKLRLDARRRVASALVKLGDKSGVPVLIDVLTAAADDDAMSNWDYDRHVAGEHLNSVSGTSSYVGRQTQDKDHGFTRWEGNFAEAAKAFRTWWETAKDKLAFDPEKGTWSVK